MAIDKNKIIEAATKFVQKGQYDKAIKEYNKLLEVDPRDARIQQKLGELYQKKGEGSLAADCFLKVAESYSADGFFLKAVAVYKQVLKLNPNLVDVNLKLAELHQQLGLMSDAMAQFQLVANHYDKIGDTRASLDTLRKMVDLDPDNIASRIKLAELYAREAMNPEAIGEFQHAAEYLKRNNRVDDYIKVAERLVFLDPGNIELTRELAAIYLAKQDTKRALAKLQLCFKADPKDVETLHMLAQAFKELGQVSKTVSVYKELARIYDEQDQVDEERKVWRKISELAPDDPDARARLAPARPPPAAAAPAPVAAQSYAQAAPAQAAPAAAAPASPEQISKLLTETDVYVKYGLHEKALEHLKKVFSIDPNSVEAHEKAVALYTATGNPALANESLVLAIRLAIGQGDLDRARNNLQRLCEKDPSHADIPAFLESVGGLAPVEEIAEIEDDAILVEASEDDIEVAPEPPQVDLSLDASEVDEVEESFIEAPPDDDDAALEAAAQSFGDDEVFAESVEEDELIAEPPLDDDELAISAAADQGDELVEPSDEFEDFVEPAADGYADPGGDAPFEAEAAPYDQPFDAQSDPYADDGFGDEDEFDNSGEEATRVVSLPAMLAAQAEAAKAAAAAQSNAPPPQWPNEEGNEDVTSVLPDLSAIPAAVPEEVFAEASDEFSDFADDEAVIDDLADQVANELAGVEGDEFGGEFADDYVEPAADELAEDVVDEFAEPAAEEFAEDVVDEFAEPAADEFVDDGAGEFAEPAADDFVEDAVDAPAEPVAEEFADDGADELAEPAAEEFVDDGADDFAEPAAEEYAAEGEDDFAEPAAEEYAADEYAEPPPEEDAPEPQEAAEPAAEEPAEEPAAEEDEEPGGDELDEAAFFVEQGELDEAREILKTVVLAYPKSKRAQELMARLEAKERGEEEPAAEEAPADEAPAGDAAPQDFAFDLASELADEDFGDLAGGDEGAPEDFQYSVEDVFNEFKKGVEKIVRPEDVDTHYDLGIAYKEMGLIDDAIGEFEQAGSVAVGKKKEVECLTMIGLCRAERDEHEAAVTAFTRGLKAAAITPDSATALHFEIGLSLEKLAQLPRALTHYLKVEKADPKFRGIKGVVERLRSSGVEALADSEEITEPTPKPKPKPQNGAADRPARAPAAAAKPGTAAAKPGAAKARPAAAGAARPDPAKATTKPDGAKPDAATAKKNRNIGFV